MVGRGGNGLMRQSRKSTARRGRKKLFSHLHLTLRLTASYTCNRTLLSSPTPHTIYFVVPSEREKCSPSLCSGEESTTTLVLSPLFFTHWTLALPLYSMCDTTLRQPLVTLILSSSSVYKKPFASLCNICSVVMPFFTITPAGMWARSVGYRWAMNFILGSYPPFHLNSVFVDSTAVLLLSG